VAYVQHCPGNLHGRLPGFTETTFMVAVQPDLTIEMPTPRFAFFVLNIGADSALFTSNESQTLKLPVTTFEGLKVAVDRDERGVHLADAQGPLMRLRSTHPAPEFHARSSGVSSSLRRRGSSTLASGIGRAMNSSTSARRRRRAYRTPTSSAWRPATATCR